MDNCYTSDDLYHWGVKGMKWGIRRYQNKDGSLTPAGQKRYNKEMAKLQEEQRVLANKKRTKEKMDRLENLRKQNEETKAALSNKPKEESKENKSPSGKKSISEMTDAELQAHNQRLRMEKESLEMQTRINQLTPQKVSAGKQFIDKYGSTIVNRLWNDVGKDITKKGLENALGLKAPESELDKLKKEAETWKAKASIARDKKNSKQWTDEYNNKLKEENAASKKQTEKNTKKQDESNERAQKQAEKQKKTNERSAENTSTKQKQTNKTSETSTPKTSSADYLGFSGSGEKWYKQKSRSSRNVTIDMQQSLENGELWVMDTIYERD